MRKKNRDLNVFSISAIDLFASAFGAVTMVMFVLLPYYLKQDNVPLEDYLACQAELAAAVSEIEDIESQLDQTQSQLQSAQSALQSAQAEIDQLEAQIANQPTPISPDTLEACEAQLGLCRQREDECRRLLTQTFLIVLMSWPDPGQDVDLHVLDPQGREYFYQTPNTSGSDFPGSPASLSLDNIEGPGVELWQHPQATPGDYIVCYKYFENHGGPRNAQVSGMIFFQTGRQEIPLIRMPRIQEKLFAATISVTSGGEVRVNTRGAGGRCPYGN